MIKCNIEELKEVIELMESHQISIVFGYSLPDYGSFVAPFPTVGHLRDRIEEITNDKVKSKSKTHSVLQPGMMVHDEQS